MRKITITVTNADCEVLDSETIEVDDNTKGICFRPSSTSIPKRGDEDILLIGE